MIKSAIITGGGSGIGRALCHKLSDNGINVLAIGRRHHALEETASYAGGLIKPFSADITDFGCYDKILETTRQMHKPVGLFHGAGHFQIGKLSKLDQPSWQKSFEINVSARFLLTQALLSVLEGGRVLFIGSDAGNKVRFGAAAYSIAQAASQVLYEGLRKELEGINIAVGLFKPGLVKTDMVDTFMNVSEEEFPDVTFYRDWVKKGELVMPETIADFARWLLITVNRDEFKEKIWDIREGFHHKNWLNGSLY